MRNILSNIFLFFLFWWKLNENLGWKLCRSTCWSKISMVFKSWWKTFIVKLIRYWLILMLKMKWEKISCLMHWSFSAIKKKQITLKWIDSRFFAERLIAFAAVEGIFFSEHFVLFIGWKTRINAGLTFSNELISDEGVHRILYCTYNHHLVVNKVPKERIRILLLML
jgi:hypothetical protein